MLNKSTNNMRSDVYKLRIFKNEKQIKFASKKPFGMVVSVEVSCTLLDIKKREIYYENRQPTKKKKNVKTFQGKFVLVIASACAQRYVSSTFQPLTSE